MEAHPPVRSGVFLVRVWVDVAGALVFGAAAVGLSFASAAADPVEPPALLFEDSDQLFGP